MIIRFTIEDNDFMGELDMFARKLFNRLYFNPDFSFETSEKVQKILNPVITPHLSIENKTTIEDACLLTWCSFVDNLDSSKYLAHTKEYLKKNFKVSIVDKFVEQWENGEVIYYFSVSQKYIIQ